MKHENNKFKIKWKTWFLKLCLICASLLWIIMWAKYCYVKKLAELNKFMEGKNKRCEEY